MTTSETDCNGAERRLWEGVAFCSIITFFCAIFIVNYEHPNVDTTTVDLALKKIMLWFGFSLAAGLGLYAPKNTKFIGVLKLSALPGVVLFLTLLFIYLGSFIFSPAMSTNVDRNSTQTAVEKPVVFLENGEYYVLFYPPNASFAPLPYRKLISKDDPILKKAEIRSITESRQNVFSMSLSLTISIIFFALISAMSPIAIATSFYAKSRLVDVITWLSYKKSGQKLENIESNLSRIISIIALVGTITASLLYLR